MSWNENGRKNRMYKIMELLKLNPGGVRLEVIARETGKTVRLFSFTRISRPWVV